MEAAIGWKSTVFFIGILEAAISAVAIADQAQTVTKPEASKPAQSEARAAPNAPQKKPSKAGVWHHFGETDKDAVAVQNQAGVWHRFGPSHVTSKLNPEATAPQEDFSNKRLADLERRMWALINHDRSDPQTFAETDGRAQALKWNESLAVVARAHSRNMLERQFFSHIDPDGTTFMMRINQAGIPWQAAGENIAIYETVSGAEAAFMNEPRFQHNHRANIVNASYTDVGIGIVQGPDGSLYITQDFVATPSNGGAVRSAP